MIFIFLLITYVISSAVVYPSGRIIDKIGGLKMTFIGLFFIGIFTLLYAFASNSLQFLLITIGISVSYHIWRVAMKTSIMDQTKMGGRGEQIGFYKSVEGLGTIIGPLVGGILIDTISIQAPFIFAGILGMFFVVAISFSRILHR